MIRIEKDTKVYVICPANIATGGPELLHQIAAQLNTMGINSSMFYLPADVENPVHPNYVHYNVRFVRDVENDPKNVIIIPESYAVAIYEQRFSKMQKIFWWLSVDNYFPQVEEMTKRHSRKKTFWFKQLFNYYKIPAIHFIAKEKKMLHLVQSAYAKDYLEKNKVRNIAYLSDYLNKEFLTKAEKTSADNREDLVLYNPKKGFAFTEKIMLQSPHLNWKAIENMTPEEVAALLAKSKVYIDFGNHPGKDRFPREAAIMGCCVITGKRGSANFAEDVPIGDEFKFEDEEMQIPAIITKIESCFKNFEEETAKFNSYRNRIKTEQQKFNDDLTAIFKL